MSFSPDAPDSGSSGPGSSGLGSSGPRGGGGAIDARGPRFGAVITSVLLLVALFLGLTGLSGARSSDGGAGWAVATSSLGDRASDPGFVVLAAIALHFAWGAIAGIQRHPWAVVFRTLVRPRLAPPVATEDPRPPTFAQGVGLAVTLAGVVLHLAGVPLALPVSAGAAFIAAFLNAAFGLCLGCMMYLGLERVRHSGRLRRA
ncbi:DUF4395 domain-containing protein [Marisediminicola sp. LYQ85]|uniref:DUF4395 domain-containing protein n=1 Tax=Marisediminicola sp. LYQ85 TaxID=3391062 RepID=UPI0039831E24